MQKYEYNICNEPDKDIFEKQCVALENHIPGIVKSDLLTDVDGSETQIYIVDNKRITVHNSYYVGAIYIKSDIDLDLYF